MGGTENTGTERCTLRYLVAQIVLATDVPMPEQISVFDEGSVSLRFLRNDEAHAWAQFLSAKAEPYVYKGDRYAGVRGTTWHGWYVQINASEPASPTDSLDEDITDALREVES
jgi:hypothetical protein